MKFFHRLSVLHAFTLTKIRDGPGMYTVRNRSRTRNGLFCNYACVNKHVVIGNAT